MEQLDVVVVGAGAAGLAAAATLGRYGVHHPARRAAAGAVDACPGRR